ncbi:type II secretion system F family protein [Naumannella halotolerans]|uniref:Flp pilus assembly protein TadB n=1 Tax=Naumannella halotolerans TaxID=993414 RepID=A0A4R7J470_9ACTN|nr:type II secretion system F family protein [Naumannella halotolerans]TDT31147.1 Flp pilus assembly protein TadB [Naumannella halotolerans]
MNAALAGACGALIGLGITGCVLGLRRTERGEARNHRSAADWWAVATRRPAGPAGRRRDLTLGVTATLGMIIFALTGWVLAIVLLPALALILPYLLGTPRHRDIEVMEALDRWVRGLATVLPTGKSVVDAIRITCRQAPAAIATDVTRLVARLDERWPPDAALRALADEIDSADADAVIGALILSVRRGGTGSAAVLKALSDGIQDRLRARREIEAERAKPRVVVRQITVITMVVLGSSVLLGQGFLGPYTTVVGQAILACLVAAYLGSLIMLRRLTNPPRRERLLIGGRDGWTSGSSL